MNGSLVNFLAIIVGAGLGMLMRLGISNRYRDMTMQAMGLVVLLIGIKMALASQNSLVLVISMALGTWIGTLADLEGLLNRLSVWLTQKAGHRFGDVGTGFVTASLVYCIGAMAIVGSIQEGLTGDASILYAKALIDGTVSVVFAASMGIGVMLAAVPVLVYQGLITWAAGGLQAFVTEAMLQEIGGVGGLLILAIAFNMLQIAKIKLANLLPALPLAVLFVWLGWF